MEDSTRARPVAGSSAAELVRELSEQVTRLVRDELRLAQLEMARKGKRAGLGIGVFSGAGLLALSDLAACWPPRSSGWPPPWPRG